jgi:hypothetical protein
MLNKTEAYAQLLQEAIKKNTKITMHTKYDMKIVTSPTDTTFDEQSGIISQKVNDSILVMHIEDITFIVG